MPSSQIGNQHAHISGGNKAHMTAHLQQPINSRYDVYIEWYMYSGGELFMCSREGYFCLYK